MPKILAPSMTERMERGDYMEKWSIILPPSTRVAKIFNS